MSVTQFLLIRQMAPLRCGFYYFNKFFSRLASGADQRALIPAPPVTDSLAVDAWCKI